jgi:His-Xaa-Ser system radical SAM maturase HxsC
MSYKILKVNRALSDITHDENVFNAVTHNAELPKALRSKKALIFDEKTVTEEFDDWSLVLVKGKQKLPNNMINFIQLDEALNHLSDDDVIKFNPKNNSIRALYRHKANANAFLLTEQCNSLCVMCSQPPRNIDDATHFHSLFQSLPLIPKSAKEITFTGGEPTLNFPYFLEALRRAKYHLPNTGIHVLTNGRNLEKEELAKNIADINHHDLMLGIPLYSDDEECHDFVVQSKGAFTQTIKGILNLYKHKVPIEIRVVVHKYTWERLPQLAEYISRNLPFIKHINFMGLEREGYGKLNFDDLWIEPEIFQKNLEEAINQLDMVGISTRLYNYAQCMLPESLRYRAKVSISDWKNEFREECDSCVLKDNCCGLFKSIASAKNVKISPIYK